MAPASAGLLRPAAVVVLTCYGMDHPGSCTPGERETGRITPLTTLISIWAAERRLLDPLLSACRPSSPGPDYVGTDHSRGRIVTDSRNAPAGFGRGSFSHGSPASTGRIRRRSVYKCRVFFVQWERCRSCGEEVSERLGHASATITLETYAHVLPDQRVESAQVIGRVLDG